MGSNSAIEALRILFSKMKAAMKAAMKSGMKKAMKKAMKKSKVGKGKLAKVLVLRGAREKTVGGLTKDSLMKNKSGRVVSKKKSQAAKKRFASSALCKWGKAVAAAKKALGITGFVAVNGKTAQGRALYAKAKAIYKARVGTCEL